MIQKLFSLPRNIGQRIPMWFALVFTRIAVGHVFWASGQTKVNGWHFWQPTDATFYLFDNVYNLPLIPSSLAAYLASFSENVLSVCLIVGLFTRFSALAFLIMTATIQFLVFPNLWPDHILWAAALLVLLHQGGGTVSLDALVARYLKSR